MKIIKEYAKGSESNRFVLRTSTYSHTMKYLEMLVDEAKIDFPELTSDDIEIAHFGGIHYRGTYGIEFDSNKNPPEDYTKWDRLESLL